MARKPKPKIEVKEETNPLLSSSEGCTQGDMPKEEKPKGKLVGYHPITGKEVYI